MVALQMCEMLVREAGQAVSLLVTSMTFRLPAVEMSGLPVQLSTPRTSGGILGFGKHDAAGVTRPIHDEPSARNTMRPTSVSL